MLTPFYGAIVARYPRRVFIPIAYAFFAVGMIAFSTIASSENPSTWVAIAFYIWVSVFNLFVVAVFWSFMADVYHHAEARPYHGYIGAAGPPGSTGPRPWDVGVRTRGPSQSGPQTAHLYLSADTKIQGILEFPTTPDRLVAPVQIPSLAPGRCATGQANGQSPFPQGAYYLGAIIDEMKKL